MISGYLFHQKASGRIRVRLLGGLGLVAVTFFSPGCASMSIYWDAAPPIDQFQPYNGPDGIHISPGSVDMDIPDVDILSISSDMMSALDNAVDRRRNAKSRLDQLVKFLVYKVRYDTQADGYGAKTARETFESGSGNCLSFSNLFVATARYAGLKATYQEIPTPPNWERDGEALIFTRHIGASVDITEHMDQMILFELGGLERALALDGTRRYFFVPTMLNSYSTGVNWRFVSMISDQRAFAQYYNNLGSRYLAEGNGSEAFRYFIKAVKMAPKLGFAWSNLGVAYSRNHQFEAAGDAFLRGIAVTRGKRDTIALSIMSNMVELYKRSGDEEKAAFYKGEVAAFRQKNPYYQYALAQTAYNSTDYEQAVRRFKEAIRLKGNDHLFHYGLALAYAKLGNVKKAEKYIRKAKFYASDEINKSYYDKVRRDIENGSIN